MASENDMRRHNQTQHAAMAPVQEPQLPPASNADEAVAEAAPADVTNNAPTVVVEPPPLPPPPPAAVAVPSPAGDEPESFVFLERPGTPPIQTETQKHRRFSMLRFRNASDPQLSARAKQHAEAPPPLPRRMSCPTMASRD